MRNRLSYLWRGLLYGALAGFVSAEVYIALLALLTLIVNNGLSALTGLYLGQIGLIPAVSVGVIAGLCIGVVFAAIGKSFDARTGAILGLVTAISLILLLVLVWFRADIAALAGQVKQILDRQDLSSFLAMVLPILALYLASGAWVGGRLHGGKFYLSTSIKYAAKIGLSLLVIGLLGVGAFKIIFTSQTKEVEHQVKITQMRTLSAEYADQDCMAQGFKDQVTFEMIDEPGYQLEACTDGAAAFISRRPPQISYKARLIVRYTRFKFKGFNLVGLDDWNGKGVWHFTGTLPCVNWTSDDARGTDCGGERSQAATQRVFDYFR